MSERTGIYPGTFDPVTLGHADIMRRGAKLVDKLIIGVTTNPSKNPMFSTEERLEMVRSEAERLGLDNIEVKSFDALLMHFAEREGASVIIRGLRAVSDFEYEFQMAGMNQAINEDIDLAFLMADVALTPVASKLVKEIALYGGDISSFVSDHVREKVIQRVAAMGKRGDY